MKVKDKELRAQMKNAIARELAKTTALHLLPAKLTTDNAAMFAALRALNNDFTQPVKLKAQENLGP